MFEITIKGETLEELAGNVQRMAGMYQTVPVGGDAAPKRAPRKAKPEDKPETEELSAEDAKLEAELKAPVKPMPETATQVVDAGTGQPVGDQPIQMTMDDVKVAAAQLAAKDTPALAAALKKYGAGKLSEVPKEQLGDFAADVMEALG